MAELGWPAPFSSRSTHRLGRSNDRAGTQRGAPGRDPIDDSVPSRHNAVPGVVRAGARSVRSHHAHESRRRCSRLGIRAGAIPSGPRASRFASSTRIRRRRCSELPGRTTTTTVEHLRPGDPRSRSSLQDECDLIVLVWTTRHPTGWAGWNRSCSPTAGRTLCIDHHPSRETPWARLVLDQKACATAVMVHELVREMRLGAGPAETAQAIYVGLATDTGFFRFNSARCLVPIATAAELLEPRCRIPRPGLPRRSTSETRLAFTRLLGPARWPAFSVVRSRTTWPTCQASRSELIDSARRRRTSIRRRS